VLRDRAAFFDQTKKPIAAICHAANFKAAANVLKEEVQRVSRVGTGCYRACGTYAYI